jgi:lysophospholipase L1-like esterase
MKLSAALEAQFFNFIYMKFPIKILFRKVCSSMKRIKDLGLIFIVTIFFLIIVEILSGYIFSDVKRAEHVYQYSYMTGYVYDPYLAFRMHNFPAVGDLERSDKSSIYILGGSTAIGVGVKELQNTYFKILERNLISEHRFKESQIINFAVPGFVSNQEAATYKEHIFNRPIAPKAVVSLSGFNDTYFYLFRTLSIGKPEFNYAFDLIFRKGYPSPNSYPEKVRNFIRQSNLFTLFHSILNKSANGDVEPIRLSTNFQDPFQAKIEPTDIKIIQNAATNFLNNCLSTALLAKFRGTKYIVILQPNYYYGGQLTVENNEWFDQMSKLEAWIRSVGQQKAAYDKFYEIVIAGLSGYKRIGILDFYDYRDKLKYAGPVYKDPVHFNEEGSKIIAESMTADIKKLLLK